MLQHNPSGRPGLADILSSTWMNNGVAPASEEEIRVDFDKRRQQMNVEPMVRASTNQTDANARERGTFKAVKNGNIYMNFGDMPNDVEVPSDQAVSWDMKAYNA